MVAAPENPNYPPNNPPSPTDTVRPSYVLVLLVSGAAGLMLGLLLGTKFQHTYVLTHQTNLNYEQCPPLQAPGTETLSITRDFSNGRCTYRYRVFIP